MKIYTIGHSIRSLDEFVDLLKAYKIELLVDIRSFPSSKKFPHFNKENLEEELEKNKIEYFHLKELGGFRSGGYLAFTQTEEFLEGIKKLLQLAKNKNTVICCAEWKFWRCHRRYVSQALVSLGHEVIHIINNEKIYEHKSSKDLEEKMKVRIFCDKIKPVLKFLDE